jgi:hypothetical protein
MRYYKFNRRRFFYPVDGFRRSLTKKSYQINTDRSRMLNSGYFENETWGALHKCWKGYVIAKNNFEQKKIVMYATRIQKLQRELGLPISSFPGLDMSELGFPEEDIAYRHDEQNSEECSKNGDWLALFRRMKEEDLLEPPDE